MVVYITVQLIGCILALPSHIYQVVWWRPGVSNYNVMILYILGIFSANYVATSGIPVMLLSLDRCMILKFKTYYTPTDA
ncbi:hypothetical protein Ddc_16212 [Ditylenchus destructor]|nr:hypothetical protein Ddc_16212 [Ditylenchus destructor]